MARTCKIQHWTGALCKHREGVVLGEQVLLGLDILATTPFPPGRDAWKACLIWKDVLPCHTTAVVTSAVQWRIASRTAVPGMFVLVPF